MPIFDKVNGVYRKANKSYSRVNGVWRKDKKIYDRVNGVWREAFSNGIEWTYEIEVTKGSGYAESVGCSSNHSAYCNFKFIDLKHSTRIGLVVTYIFKTPLILPSGSNLWLEIHSGRYSGHSAYAYGDVHSSEYEPLIHYLFNTGNFSTNDEGYHYDITSDITLDKLYVRLDTQGDYGTPCAWIDVVVNPLNGDSFLLNNSGTSDQ